MERRRLAKLGLQLRRMLAEGAIHRDAQRQARARCCPGHLGAVLSEGDGSADSGSDSPGYGRRRLGRPDKEESQP